MFGVHRERAAIEAGRTCRRCFDNRIHSDIGCVPGFWELGGFEHRQKNNSREDHTMIVTWKNPDGSVSSDCRTQLEKIKASKNPKVKENAEELADALIDIVYASFGTPVQNAGSLGYALHVLGKAGIKIMCPSADRRRGGRIKL